MWNLKHSRRKRTIVFQMLANHQKPKIDSEMTPDYPRLSDSRRLTHDLTWPQCYGGCFHCRGHPHPRPEKKKENNRQINFMGKK